jgi:WD40 repeat protein
MAGGWDGDVRLRLVPDGAAPRGAAHVGRVNAVRLAGELAVSIGDDGLVNRTRFRPGLFDLAAMPPIDVGPDGCSALAVSADGAVIAAAGTDGAVRIFDGRAASPAAEVADTRAAILALDIDQSGRRVAAGGMDGVVHVYDRRAGRWTGRWKVADQAAVTALALTPGGSLASADANGTVAWWPPARDARADRVVTVLGRHEGAVGALAVTAEGTVISAGRRDGLVRAWSVPDRDDGKEHR